MVKFVVALLAIIRQWRVVVCCTAMVVVLGYITGAPLLFGAIIWIMSAIVGPVSGYRQRLQGQIDCLLSRTDRIAERDRYVLIWDVRERICDNSDTVGVRQVWAVAWEATRRR